MTRWLAVVVLLQASGLRAGELPRLTGTVVAPGNHVALFSAGSGGSLPVGIGDPVGEYVVREIGPGRVRLQGAERQVVVLIEGAAAPPSLADTGGVTFGLVLHRQGPPDD